MTSYRRALRNILFLTLLATALPGRFAFAGEDLALGEYDLKAAFLINFARYCEWTGAKPAKTARPLVIGILGKNPFGDKLERLAKASHVGVRKVQVVVLESAKDLKGAEVVFLADRDPDRVRQALEALEGRGILTVGDPPRSVEWGTVLAFVPEGSKIRFAVNLTAARGQKVKVSSKLLQLAVKILP